MQKKFRREGTPCFLQQFFKRRSGPSGDAPVSAQVKYELHIYDNTFEISAEGQDNDVKKDNIGVYGKKITR